MTAPPPHEAIAWSRDLEPLAADAPADALLDALREGGAYYIVIRRAADRWYVFTAGELRALREVQRWRHDDPPPGATVLDAFAPDGLGEHDATPRYAPGGTLRSEPFAGGPPSMWPARSRAVEVADDGTLLRAGEDASRLTLGRGPREPWRPFAEDGTSPLRHPVIDAESTLAAGAEVVIVVDLRRAPDAATRTSGVTLPEQRDDWQTLEVTVEIGSAHISFANATGTITVRRDADSIAARFPGRVHDTAKTGSVQVEAFFVVGGRDCGAARRRFALGDADAFDAGPPSPPLRVEPGVVPPELTVRIHRVELPAGHLFMWHCAVRDGALVATHRLDGALRSQIALPDDATAWARRLYDELAGIEGARLLARFENVGLRIWERTPPPFREVYWALRDALGDGFSIQFITDEPLVPWELMVPMRPGTPAGTLLCRTHPVARWPALFENRPRAPLADGGVVSIAPQYGPLDALPWAVAETAWLEAHAAARRLGGASAEELESLFRDGLDGEGVGVLHFAGHGETTTDDADAARLKLSADWLSAMDIRRLAACRLAGDGALVILNACKAGKPAEAVGLWGGWIPTLIAQGFRGVVAPLWPVFDEHAATVAEALVTDVVLHGEPVGPALQRVRAAHGGTSPTFLAYLYYGDVMARRPPLALPPGA